MQLNVLKDTLRKQLADGQTPSVLAHLMTVVDKKSDFYNALFIRSANKKGAFDASSTMIFAGGLNWPIRYQ